MASYIYYTTLRPPSNPTSNWHISQPPGQKFKRCARGVQRSRSTTLIMTPTMMMTMAGIGCKTGRVDIPENQSTSTWVEDSGYADGTTRGPYRGVNEKVRNKRLYELEHNYNCNHNHPVTIVIVCDKMAAEWRTLSSRYLSACAAKIRLFSIRHCRTL